MLYFLKKLLFRIALKIWSGPWYPNAYVIIHSVYLARAVYVATVLEIAELVQHGPRTCAELAQATGTHERSLYRVMRLLAAYNFFAEDKQGRFRLARQGHSLLIENPDSARWWVLSMGNELWMSNSQILESVKTGRTGFELAHGIPLWQWYPQNPEPHDIFIKGMNIFTDAHCSEIIRAFDFSRFKKIVDVGGGGGGLISEILRANPNVRGVLFDQPSTVEEAKPRIDAADFADRCEVIGGSFLEKIPSGADAYIFKHVLRDWDDTGVLKMLEKCHEAMAENGTLLVVDALVNPKNGKDRLIKMLDVQTMVDGGGGLRTQAEFEGFFSKTGFQLVALHRTTILDAVILEARKTNLPTPPAEASDERRKPQIDETEVIRAR
jgi:cyclopropane fatty-acyl-phospholipid synthase-like methyltransferase